MNIISVSLYSYSLKLNKPLNLCGSNIAVRKGLIIHLQSSTHDEGFGEIAPLPGFSHETLEEAKDQILSLRSYIVNEPFPEFIENLDGKFELWLKSFRLVPSVQFGIEMAVLNLIANSKNLSLNQLINDSTKPNIQIHALLSGTKEEVFHQAIQLMHQGFTSMKLKVGGPDINEDIAKAFAVSEAIKENCLLHCDANQNWTFDQAMTFGKTLGFTTLAYIEEPFKEIERIPEFFHETNIPVALDESLPQLTFNEIKSLEGVETLILKPTILGSIEKTFQIIKQAQTQSINTVISSTFESSLGI